MERRNAGILAEERMLEAKKQELLRGDEILAPCRVWGDSRMTNEALSSGWTCDGPKHYA